jgi:hypothetical protein
MMLRASAATESASTNLAESPYPAAGRDMAIQPKNLRIRNAMIGDSAQD